MSLRTMLGLEPSATAVIVIDVQNDFCHSDGAMGKMGKNLKQVEESIPALSSLLSASRSSHLPVIFVKTTHGPMTDSPNWVKRMRGGEHPIGVCRTPWGQDFYKVKPEDHETVIVKHRYSAFYGTDLDLILRSKGIQTVLLCGVAANICVETTARDAFMRDYNVITLSDCIAAYDPKEYDSAIHNMSSYFGSVISSRKVTFALENV